jgi:hypothetical protein
MTLEPITTQSPSDEADWLDAQLPAGRVLSGEFKFMLPVAATRRQVVDWIALALAHGTMSSDNPLGPHGPEALAEPDISDTGAYMSSVAIQTGPGMARTLNFVVDDTRTDVQASNWMSPEGLVALLAKTPPQKLGNIVSTEDISGRHLPREALDWILEMKRILDRVAEDLPDEFDDPA